jgi:hypothetical protein
LLHLPEAEKQLLNWSDERVEALASQLLEAWWKYSLKHDPEQTLHVAGNSGAGHVGRKGYAGSCCTEPVLSGTCIWNMDMRRAGL